MKLQLSSLKCVNVRGALAVLALWLLLSLSGCASKWPINGDLDEQWQVMEVEYAGVPVEIPEGERFYYNFYLHTMQLSTIGLRPIALKGNLTYEGDCLHIEIPAVREEKLAQKWIDRLIYWGFPKSGVMDATILKLDNSHLVFEYTDADAGTVTVTCRSF